MLVRWTPFFSILSGGVVQVQLLHIQQRNNCRSVWHLRCISSFPLDWVLGYKHGGIRQDRHVSDKIKRSGEVPDPSLPGQMMHSPLAHYSNEIWAPSVHPTKGIKPLRARRLGSSPLKLIRVFCKAALDLGRDGDGCSYDVCHLWLWKAQVWLSYIPYQLQWVKNDSKKIDYFNAKVHYNPGTTSSAKSPKHTDMGESTTTEIIHLKKYRSRKSLG